MHVLNNMGLTTDKVSRPEALRGRKRNFCRLVEYLEDLLGPGTRSVSSKDMKCTNLTAKPNIDEYGRDLTRWLLTATRSGNWPDKEIERIIQILSRRTKNNPVLIV